MYRSIQAGEVYFKQLPADSSDPFAQKGLHPVIVIEDSPADCPYIYVIACTSNNKYKQTCPLVKGTKLTKPTYARVDQGIRKVLKSKSMRPKGVITSISYELPAAEFDERRFEHTPHTNRGSSSISRPVKKQSSSRHQSDNTRSICTHSRDLSRETAACVKSA